MAERRPTLTASARAGVGNLRSGQKKACGAVEQKKGLEQESKKKALAFVAAIRERRNGSQIEQRNRPSLPRRKPPCHDPSSEPVRAFRARRHLNQRRRQITSYKNTTTSPATNTL
jgi:hypothetical protein